MLLNVVPDSKINFKITDVGTKGKSQNIEPLTRLQGAETFTLFDRSRKSLINLKRQFSYIEQASLCNLTFMSPQNVYCNYR